MRRIKYLVHSYAIPEVIILERTSGDAFYIKVTLTQDWAAALCQSVYLLSIK